MRGPLVCPLSLSLSLSLSARRAPGPPGRAAVDGPRDVDPVTLMDVS